MASFVAYDLVFLALFSLAVVIFLYKRRHNLKRQGLLYLYRTKVGIRFIEWTSRKFPRTLWTLQYLVIFSGYALMIIMIYLLIQFSYLYLASPIAAKALKVPVIVPLVPYLPEIFNLDFLPPFYFTYWIIIIALIAVPHEFAHGIFARLNKIKIHSTGFGFLGPFLAAFVEPDEKEMEKKKKFAQLSILASGTFANVVFAIIFGILFLLFFFFSFNPAGVIFSSYAGVVVNVSEINSVNGIYVDNVNEIESFINKSSKFIEVKLNDKGNELFFISTSNLLIALENNIEKIRVIYDSPAFRAGLSGAISEINGIKINSFEELREELSKYNSGDDIAITALHENNEKKEFNIELAEKEGKAFLGIEISPLETRGIIGKFSKLIIKIKDPFVYYESSLGEIGIFIYNLLWWSVLISISVALVNMLPLGIFDGGRFFYLTVWGITRSKKIGEKAFKFSTYLILAVIAALMVKWLFVYI